MKDKKTIIFELEQAHTAFRKVLGILSDDQKTRVAIHDNWTVKDIVAHLTGWHWEMSNEVERVLEDAASWDTLYTETENENAFNISQIELRKNDRLPQVVQEWEESFLALINLLKTLTDEQWSYQSGQSVWTSPPLEGQPITVASLFDYQYNGGTHEAGHAKEIFDHFQNSSGHTITMPQRS